MVANVMDQLSECSEFIRPNEALAPYTHLKIGGQAEALAQPRTHAELATLVRICNSEKIPLRILGCGCNVLVRDEGVDGVVLRLCEPAFTGLEVEGRRLSAGAGASLASLISVTARHGLAGLETLVGIPGTIGGALCHNAGDRVAEIGQFVRNVDVIDGEGNPQTRQRDEFNVVSRDAANSETVIVSVTLELENEDADTIVKRMRKAWIQRKAKKPFSFQSAIRAFRIPRGTNFASLIEQADLAGAKVGGAQISERNPSYVLVYDGATARDVLRLMEMVQSRIEQHASVTLEREPSIW